MRTSLWDIYKVFTKIGAILIGGGYVILPILKEEVVENNNWITDNELVDYYAISQSLPGIIAANISIFVGYKLRGKWGALVSTIGIITAPFICIACISSIISQVINFPITKSILWGVEFGVIILIISSVQELWSKAIPDKFSFFIFFVYLLSILKFKIPPTPIILSSIVIGIAFNYIISKRGSER